MSPLPNLAPQFMLIGERLDANREEFRTRLSERDSAFVAGEVRKQQQAGVSHLNVSAGAGPKQTNDTLWLLGAILPVLGANIGLMLTSSESPECMARALEYIKGRANTIVSAVTNDPPRIGAFAQLAVQHSAGLVAVLDQVRGAPASKLEKRATMALTPFERMAAAEQLHGAIAAFGIPDERIYFDPQVLPLAFETSMPLKVLESFAALRKRFPGVHLLAGVSNVSFNLPRRALLNRTYLAMLIAAGADAILCDPCDARLRETLLAARALAGKDDFLTDYLASM